MNVYTIGFTRKTAEQFFTSLSDNRIDVLIDIRLNNTSQLAGFTKYPDIAFFLSRICNIKYIHDEKLAPTNEILKAYKNKNIDWAKYVEQFEALMIYRNIKAHIEQRYKSLFNMNICLLCSEDKPNQCHRSLVAPYFAELTNATVINL